LAICDGGEASRVYLNCITGKVFEEEKIQIIQDLKDY
jgi:hypothetical protein